MKKNYSKEYDSHLMLFITAISSLISTYMNRSVPMIQFNIHYATTPYLLLLKYRKPFIKSSIKESASDFIPRGVDQVDGEQLPTALRIGVRSRVRLVSDAGFDSPSIRQSLSSPD